MSKSISLESLRKPDLKLRPETGQSSEMVDFREREGQLDYLLSEITGGRTGNTTGLPNLSERLVHFLASDPLSDQQAGSVARYLESEKRNPNTRLSLKERKKLVVGDWNEINRILSVNEGRGDLWRNAKRGMVENWEEVRVYRTMRLGRREKAAVARKGLFPAGVYRYGSLGGLLQDMISTLVPAKSSMPPNEDTLRYVLERSLVCKANVLLETWSETGEFGISEQYRLGISTTSEQNFKRGAVRRFGPRVLEITVPQVKLISRASQPDSVISYEDERTILYYIPPKAVKFL